MQPINATVVGVSRLKCLALATSLQLEAPLRSRRSQEAEVALDTAWRVGVRYYDVAPWYGLGLAERRFGQLLHHQKRSDYLIRAAPGGICRILAPLGSCHFTQKILRAHRLPGRG
ncbi:aldo/keto reductase [Rhizobium leguminosarum]|uniref:aldo/keto reductase n=1 Tax=Rhizobium leguminosarum TaxID=384 RepID=UPI0035115179